jgi:arabinofuranosyltransferase
MLDNPSHQTRAPVRLIPAVVCAFSLVYLFAVFRTAWITDDAYISFRTIDNFLQGYGLRWNTLDRVQTYTHPLWLLLLSAVSFVTRELYLTAIGVSIVCSAAAFYAVGALSRSVIGAVTASLLLFMSNSFVSFSTSGLENCLSHLIVALFVLVWFRQRAGRRRAFLLALLAGLGAINRLDLILLFAPALILDLCSNRKPAATAAGLVPLAAWLLFSLLYYGFLLPNSAYAKLATGLERSVYLEQGMRYAVDMVYRDTLTIVAIVAVAAAGIMSRSASHRAVAAGIVLYVCYVVWAGGDFMRGRFFTVPLIAATGLLVDADLFLKGRLRYAVPIVVVIVGMLNPVPNVLANKERYRRKMQTMYHGITDERLYYLKEGSLFLGRPLSQQPGHDMAALRRRQSIEITRIKFLLSAGKAGLHAGPRTCAIDQWALGDALLSRLPVISERWRIGHFPRVVPAGYLVSVVTGENHIRDERVREFYEHLRRITRGPLLDRERFRSIVGMNLGRYNHLVRDNREYEQASERDYVELVEADLEAGGPQILWHAARRYLFDHDVDRAEPVLRRLSSLEIARSDDYIKGAVQIGTSFAQVKPEFAERLLRLMRELEPDSPDSAYGLGRFLVNTGREEEGATHIQSAAEMGHSRAKRWLDTH